MGRVFTRLETMDPGERRTWTHDFAAELAAGETLSTILTLNATVHFTLPGITPDGSPNNIKDSVATISGTKILQGLVNPAHGNDYKLKAEVRTSTNRELMGGAILPVRTL